GGEQGVLWLYGSGEWRLFSGAGNYSSPEDAGILTGNAAAGWVYTSPEKDQTFFNGAGLETRGLHADHFEEMDYGYDGQGRLISFTAIDHTTTTLQYNNGGGLLSQINAPGGRTYTVATSGTDLGSVTDPDGRQEVFTYVGSHRLQKAVLGSGSEQLVHAWDY